ncbi:MAG: hypothetical protein ACRCZU_01125 [Selenomonadaceae bacterium]
MQRPQAIAGFFDILSRKPSIVRGCASGMPVDIRPAVLRGLHIAVELCRRISF